MKLAVRTVVAIGIGAALFFLLGRFAIIPIFANTNLTFQYALLSFFAVLFGPIAGLLIGFIGHFLIDLSFPWGLWWSWIIVSGVIGFGFGIILRGIRIDEGEFAGKNIIRFIVGTTIVHLIAWALVAPVLDIIMYAEPANRVFTQGIIAAISNSVTTAIVGTFLLFAYSKARPKTGSLSRD